MAEAPVRDSESAADEGSRPLAPEAGLSLAVSCGLGVVLRTGGWILLASLALGTLRDLEVLGPGLVWIGVLAIVLGGGLVRLRPWAPTAVGVLGLLFSGPLLSGLWDPSNLPVEYAAFAVSALSVTCLSSRVERWFTDKGAAAQRLPLETYRVGVTWLTLVLSALLVVVPAMADSLTRRGVSLPTGTQALITVAWIVERGAWIVPPFAVFAPAPLLWLPREREGVTRLSIRVIGLAALSGIAGWLQAPHLPF